MPDSLTIRTNNVPRDIIEAWELSAEERAEFDYIDWPAVDDGRESASFVRYRGELIDLGEFMAWDNPMSPTRGDWDGFRSDSFFSGLVVRYCDDHERVVIGLALS
jgi:hypothetical protein